MISLLLLFCTIFFSSAKAANVRSSSHAYDKDGYIKISRPKGSKEGDLLFLFLSRTDDVLPVKLKGWKLGASCLKKHNTVKKCYTIEECDDKRYDDFCYGGTDLGTVIFYKIVRDNEPSSYSWNIEGLKGNPAWAILAAVREANINTDNPIRSVNTVSCDRSDHSEFPSVYGKRRDALLLSMAFDDKSYVRRFGAPSGTHITDYVRGNDEAGFLYTKELTKEGETGVRSTRGPGDDFCKDALISLVVRRRK